MKHLLTLTILVVTAFTAFAQKPWIDKDYRNWSDSVPAPTGEVAYTVWLIGDAGEAERDPLEPNFRFLKSQLDVAPENSAIVFLGDNIYPAGLPTFEDPEKRAEAEKRLDSQLDLVTNFKGRPFFIPGNHDWKEWGLKGLKREEKFIEKYLNRAVKDEDEWQNYFLPGSYW